MTNPVCVVRSEKYGLAQISLIRLILMQPSALHKVVAYR